MEVSALKHAGLPGIRGPAPLLRLQSDERLVALVRRGQQAAFEVLVSRYESRLLAFCRHMLGSREDAEDVLQEVFAASFNAMLADDRPINVRPWLYRIARNRSLNHLRRAAPVGVDSMDVHFADAGESTGEKVLKRESFRQLIGDVQQLAETQRTALLLREIDNLSYEQIAEAMDTTVPSVKSLLVRARISLAEAAEARRLSCDEVRFELGEVAEGLTKISPPARRHLRECDRCRDFRAQLKANNRVMAAVFPVGALLVLRKLALAKLGSAGGAHVAGAGGATATATATAAGTAGLAGGGGGLVTVGAGALASKAVAGLAAAALVTAGAVEADRAAAPHHYHHASVAVTAPAPIVRTGEEPMVVRSEAQPLTITHEEVRRHAAARHAADKPKPAPVAAAPALTDAAKAKALALTAKPAPVKPTQVEKDTTALPPQTQTQPIAPAPAPALPGTQTTASSTPPPADQTQTQSSSPSDSTTSSGSGSTTTTSTTTTTTTSSSSSSTSSDSGTSSTTTSSSDSTSGSSGSTTSSQTGGTPAP